MELFHSDVLQSFVNGATAKALHPEKAIYQPGFLRKVIWECYDLRSCTLVQSLLLLLYITETIRMQTERDCCIQRPRVCAVTASAGHVPTSTWPYNGRFGAVLAQSGQLVNVGDYVRLMPDGSEVLLPYRASIDADVLSTGAVWSLDCLCGCTPGVVLRAQTVRTGHSRWRH